MKTKRCEFCGRDFVQTHAKKYCSYACLRGKINKQRRQQHAKSRLKKTSRFSGRSYENTPEKLEKIRKKYANGITAEIMQEFEEHLKDMEL